MNSNEKGFTYPLTLCVMILFLTAFSLFVDRLLIERKLSHEAAVILQVEYYFHSSVKKTEALLQSNGKLPAKGSFAFLNGTIDFQAEAPSGTVQIVNYTLKLHSGISMIGRGHYDVNAKKLIKWVEM